VFINGYPVILNLKDRACLIIGGGALAWEKLEGLLAVEALVTVQATRLDDNIRQLVDSGEVEWRNRHYAEGDVQGFFMAIAADLDRSQNAQIFADAESNGVLINCLDDPPHCQFIYPSLFRQGDLTVSISTNGKCPTLAVRLKQRFGAELGPEYAEFLNIAGDLRDDVASKLSTFNDRKKFWYEVVDSDALALIRNGEFEQSEALMRAILDRHAGV
jgi:siroheme synthase-like protein